MANGDLLSFACYIGLLALLLQPKMKCYTEEIFGPVLVILNADTLDEVGAGILWCHPHVLSLSLSLDLFLSYSVTVFPQMCV